MSGIVLMECLFDTIADLVFVMPLLFFTFIVIEFIEYFYFDKVLIFIEKSGKFAPLAGALIASFPQCGFSIIASVLYVKGIITRGTLLAVYLSTSDEAIPLLLSLPEQYKLVFPIIAIKILIGVIAGYIFDFILPKKNVISSKIGEFSQKGCCNHRLKGHVIKDLFIHPIIHTLIISLFIFLITFIVNISIAKCGSAEVLGGQMMKNSVFQPIIAALFGLIPNCAISVALVMLYAKGVIAFCSIIAGLCSNAGLGMWIVIVKNKDVKDSLLLVLSLFLISALSGVILYFI